MIDVEVLRSRLAAEGKLSLHIRAIPKSPRTMWGDAMDDGSIKLRVAAVPEKGKANSEIVRFLASEFDVPRGSVEIVAGETSHTKQVRVLAPPSPR